MGLKTYVPNLCSLNENLSIQSGTWTPTVIGSTTAGTPTYATQTGRYYRIGKMCFVDGFVKLSAKNDVAGAILIGGLPFSTMSGEPRSNVSIGAVAGVTYGTNKQLFAVFNAGLNTITPYFSTEGAGVGLLNAASVNDNFEIRVGGVYRLP